ncbi:unnamed protein product [Vicia faba]|uniref:Uncharacterized protein n=1 Tax=Vicia faba TaxID=3906 RepID=A0AAV1AUJ8_VICFA|nr:unnamed protein product [Vicia faba]
MTRSNIITWQGRFDILYAKCCDSNAIEVSNNDEQSKVNLENPRDDLKVRIEVFEARVVAQVEYVRVIVDHLSRTNDILNIGPYDVEIDPSIPIPDDNLAPVDILPSDVDAFP